MLRLLSLPPCFGNQSSSFLCLPSVVSFLISWSRSDLSFPPSFLIFCFLSIEVKEEIFFRFSYLVVSTHPEDRIRCAAPALLGRGSSPPAQPGRRSPPSKKRRLSETGREKEEAHYRFFFLRSQKALAFLSFFIRRR